MGRNSLKIYLDTNILLDVLSPMERPCSKASRTIFQAIRSGYMEAVLSTQSILDAAYILSKATDYSPVQFSRQILLILSFINIRSIDSAKIRDAMSSPSEDLEDNAQFALADSEGCDLLVTSDRYFRRDRATTDLPIFTPEELVARMTGSV